MYTTKALLLRDFLTPKQTFVNIIIVYIGVQQKLQKKLQKHKSEIQSLRKHCIKINSLEKKPNVYGNPDKLAQIISILAQKSKII